MIAIPTRALEILPLAASTLALSPPEVIHWIPPQTRNANTMMPETRNAAPMAPAMSVPTSVIWNPAGLDTVIAPDGAAKATPNRLSIVFTPSQMVAVSRELLSRRYFSNLQVYY